MLGYDGPTIADERCTNPCRDKTYIIEYVTDSGKIIGEYVHWGVCGVQKLVLGSDDPIHFYFKCAYFFMSSQVEHLLTMAYLEKKEEYFSNYILS